MYIGMETQSQDLRSNSPTPEPQGAVALGFQVSNLMVIRQPIDASYQSLCRGTQQWP